MSKQGTRLNKIELVATLRNYLPSSIERQCILGDEIKAPNLCVRHLDTLLRTVSTYLPRQVVVPLLENPEAGRVEGGFTYGTVMFADISGFTAMSEKLSQLGKEGAEEVTRIINHLFTALLEVADHYGGDLLKFGGDALLVFFGDEKHTLNACIAALQMQETMAQFSEMSTPQGTFRLRMSVGLGTGPLFMAKLGSEEGMEFAVMGQAMAQMAQAESLASAGEIFIDTETYHQLCNAADGQAISKKVQAGFHQLVSFQEGNFPDLGVEAGNPLNTLAPPPTEGDTLPWITDTVQRIRALELFLPPGLMAKIRLEPERIAIGGEYRPVTVFFANFYGINEIIEELGKAHDPERAGTEITAILNTHFKTMRSIIAKYGGVVNKVDTYAVGHRIMALFGAPRAHMDDPERAVRAALDMQDAMLAFAKLDTSCGSFSLKQRIGINTGLVFAGNVGSLSHQEYSVMGDGVNLAARLMAMATDGQVVISQNTARQSGDTFLLFEQEPVRVKGKSLPVHNHEVISVQERRIRVRRPLIGRDDEWQTIHALTDLSLAGQTQTLDLVGDAGLGKSCLIDEITAHWSDEHGALSINVTCPSFGRHTPYLPWLDLLRNLFGFNPADPDRVKLEKIEALLQEIDPTWHDWTTLIGRLLGIDVEETDLTRALDAQTRQRMTFRIVAGLVAHVASEQPLLLTIDDLQWADDTSVELVNHVARQATGQPLLMVLTYRPDESLTAALKVADLAYHTNIRLKELSDEASLRLLEMLLPTTPQVPQQLKDLILKNAQGNPLFIEEVAHSLIENYLTLDEKTGTYHARTDLEDIEVPDSVNRVIMSRIDRLTESSRNVVKVASVIGQEFEHWLLRNIYPYRRAEGELVEQLNTLSQREILEGPLANLSYLFRHILTREVAYESLLYVDRRQLHRGIGDSIEAQQADRLAEYGEVLAYHYGLAEEWDKALYYHLQAGRKAQSIYANEDAIHHFRQALKAAEQVPYSEGHQLEVHEKLGETLDTLGNYDEALTHIYQAQDMVMLVGYSPEENARWLAKLCHKTATVYEKKSDYEIGLNWLYGGLITLEGMNTIEMARIYLVGAGIYHRQGNNAKALEWCQHSLDIAGRLQDQGEAHLKILAHAYYLQGAIHLRYGDNARVVDVCKNSLRICEQIGDIARASQAHINMATAYFEQGNWPQATEHYLRALEIKRKIGDVYGQGFVTVNLGGVYLDRGEVDQAASYYQQSLEMWQELGNTYVIALLYNNMGSVALRRGDPDEAITLLHKSLEMFQQIGSGDFLPEVYRLLAKAYLDQGELDTALDRARHSLTLAQEQKMHQEKGETCRVLGQIYIARQELDQAEQELEKSLGILEELNSRYEVGKTLFQLARLYRIRGEQGQMLENLRQALRIFEDLGARIDLAQAQELEVE